MTTVEPTTERGKPRFRSDNEDLAGEVNQELARLINAAGRELDQDDRDQLRLYWQVRDELFGILDMAFLLMTDRDVTKRQAEAIAGAMRTHIGNCMARWRERLDDFRIKQAELREKLAEINAGVRALMGEDEYSDDEVVDAPDLDPEQLDAEPEPPAVRSTPKAPAKPGQIKISNSFFGRRGRR